MAGSTAGAHNISSSAEEAHEGCDSALCVGPPGYCLLGKADRCGRAHLNHAALQREDCAAGRNTAIHVSALRYLTLMLKSVLAQDLHAYDTCPFA